jgi:hypothetical protein
MIRAATAAAALLTAAAVVPAVAGGLEEPVIEPTPVVTPVVPTFAPSFTGGYVGGSLGAGSLDVGDRFDFLDGDTDIDDTDTDLHYGLHAGYNIQRGNVVFGPELAVFGTSSEIDGSFDEDETDATEDEGDIGVDLNYGIRLAARGGYAFGSNLVYGVAGAAFADVDSRLATAGDAEDSDWGYAVGFGYERLIGERFVVGAQYTLHAFDEFGDAEGAEDLDYRTLEARVSLKF